MKTGRLFGNMTDIKVVIGANFGDEGKGLMTDYFCHKALNRNENCIVILSNGGAQRGHTVTAPDGTQHVFHHFGSGTLVGADTYCISDYILNPMTFVKEWVDLRQLGYDPNNLNFYFEDGCRWSTPYDMIVNQIVEAAREDKKHGSCGMGIWETIVRYEKQQRGYSLFHFDLLPKEAKINYLKSIRDGYMRDRLKELGVSSIPLEWYSIVYSDMMIEHFINDVHFMICHTKSAGIVNLSSYKNIVFENGQGLLLDKDNTFYGDNTTPTSTGWKNVAGTVNRHFDNSDEINMEVCYVTRTYMTRHGVGRFETECDKSLINSEMFDETNVTNPFQDNLRYGELIIPNLVARTSADFENVKLHTLFNVNMTASVAVTHTNEYEIDYSRIRDKLINNVYTSNSRTRDSVKIFTDF
jgi:adenylosuccinate synthase